MRLRDEDGFTLAELMLTMVIGGIVMAAMVNSIVVGLRTTDETSTRLAESRGAQITSAHFLGDAQSSDDVSTSDTDCSGVTPVVRFAWTDAGVAKVASWFVQTASGERRLVRAYCEGGSPVATVVGAHYLSPVVDPVVACTGLAGSSCTGEPETIKLTVTESSGYVFDVTATRRVS